MTFNKDAFFEAGDSTNLTPVNLGGTIGTLYIRPIAFSEFEKIRQHAGDQTSEMDWTIYLVIWCACYEDGAPVFDLDDFGKLRAQSMGLLQPLLTKATEVNGFDQSQETVEGKSEATTS